MIKEPDSDLQTLYSYICPACGAIYMRQFDIKKECIDCGRRFPEKMKVEKTSRYKYENKSFKSDDWRK